MPRPRDIGVIDLMLEIPAGGAVMSMEPARRLTRDAPPAWLRGNPSE